MRDTLILHSISALTRAIQDATVFTWLCCHLRSLRNYSNTCGTLSPYFILRLVCNDPGLRANDLAVQYIKHVCLLYFLVSSLSYIRHLHRAEKVLYPLIAAIGIGCLFQVRINRVSLVLCH